VIMTYHIQKYPNDKGYHDSYYKVLHFLNKKNEAHEFIHFHWSRWEWMFARDNIKTEELSQIIMFLNGQEELCGLLSYEDEPGVWFAIYDNDLDLKKQMVDYFLKTFSGAEIIISEDEPMIDLLKAQDYEQTDWIDPVAKFKHKHIEVPKTEGYDIVSLEDDYRLENIHYALWRGFDHGDDVIYSHENLENRRHMTSSPYFKKAYTYVARFEEKYVSYAGIWYIKGTKTALIEPVATVPEHRRKGLARACIYKAIQAAYKDGAKDIFVGSNRKIYQDMGFEPYMKAIRFKKI